jgi:molybdopterin synthase sulfur carrier subunit
MSTVEVRLYTSLRKYHPKPGNSEALSMELDDKAKLGDLLDKLKIPREELGIIMVNGKWEKESYLPKDGDRIGMFSLVGGG